MTPDEIARVCHEANRAYCLAIGEDPKVVYPTWEDCPAEIRTSAFTGVMRALAGSTPKQLHESWFDGKASDGWVWGPTKNLDLKQHPCMVRYEDLPVEQQKKDALFQAVVQALR